MRLAPVISILICLSASLAAADGSTVISPLVTQPPQINGILDEAVWPQPQIANFYLTSSFGAAPKTIQCSVCHDAKQLYLGFRVSEPKPALLKHEAPDGSQGVWKDDCLEIFLRTGDSALDFFQFIANCAGARQSERCRNGVEQAGWRPEWTAAAKIGADCWVVEVAIPFASLELATPAAGDMVQLGIGREDRTKTGPALTNWPAAASYGGMGGYGRLFFVTDNQLRNPALTEQKDGKFASWTFSGEDAKLFTPIDDQGRRAIRFQSPGRYAIMQQGLSLKPNSTYRLSALVRGNTAYLRARTSKLKTDPVTTAYSVTAKASSEYQPVEVTFPTGETGSALIVLGSVDSSPVGDVFIADLRVSQDVTLTADGPAIDIPGGKPVHLKKLLVSDCRALKGFVTSPVDGRLNSYNWNLDSWEYNQPGAGAGVGYAYNNNEGLHVTLADKGGVDAVQIKPGAKVMMYAGADLPESPGKAPLLWEFKGRSQSSRAILPKRAMTDRLSFFNLTDGRIADCTALRIESEAPRGKAGASFAVGAVAQPAAVSAEMSARFPEAQRATRSLGATVEPFTTPDRLPLHLVSAPLAAETSLDAMTLQLKLHETLANCPLTVAIQDPLSPLGELMSAEVQLTNGNQFTLVCDFPDQVVPAGRPLWLTLTFGAPLQVDEARVQLVELPREQALPESLAYRKLLMRGMFCQLSEARQWGNIRKNTDVEKFLSENRWGPGIRELLGYVAYCKELAPNDELVRTYDEWLWRSSRDLPPFTPKLDDVPGAPQWAALLRQTWLANRAVCDWWVRNRLVPSGEFGGLVGDDSDMYQNYADLPMLENNDVAWEVRRGARNLAELAEQQNLEYGLNSHSTDPLHAYEEGVNHESLMLWWEYGDPVYFERCLLAAKYLPKTTVVTEKGHRHFKSQVIGSEDVRIDRPVDVDGGAHPLMWHPALEVAWYNRSPAVLKYLDEWATGWAAHDEPGKYATSVDVKTDTTKETTARPLYGGYSAQACTRTWLYFMTGQERYIEPFIYYLKKGQIQLPMKGFLPELYHRGLMDGLSTRDYWLDQHAILPALARGDKQPLIEALKADLTELQRFGWMSTGAEVFTDRVFLYGLQNTAVAYTGGYATRNKFNHTHGVSWLDFGTDYAALVLQNRPDKLKVLLYSFADKPMQGRFRTWMLDHGRYKITQGPDANGDDQMDRAASDATVEVVRGECLPLTLQPRQVTVLELTQVEKLDDLTARADLALSRLDLKVENGKLSGFVHNIGAKDAPQFTVMLLDAKGQPQGTVTLGPLAAPTDLEPKRIPFSFLLKTGGVKGWMVTVDPTGKLPEIYRGNNVVTVGVERG